MSLKLFARLTKVDEEKRLVYGRATEEVVDRAGEIMDYATSKPYFEKWSGDIAKATDGKSVGNLRAMHGNVAAGKLTGIDFRDDEKAIDICTKVVDDNEWNKVLEGVYTGFSIGGDYVKRWADAELSARRFTADPCEISLVDLPCVPTASFFSIEKADGSVMQKVFKAAESPSTSAVDELAKMLNDGEVKPEDLLALIKAKKEEGKYGDVEYADTANKKYPIDTEEHIRAAWSYINKEKDAAEYSADELKTVKDRIVAAWKDKIDKDGPPAAADKTVEPVITKSGKPVIVTVDNLSLAARLALHKGMYGVSTFAQLLASISYLQQSAAREEATERDGSTMPDELMAWLKQGTELLTAMVAEEVAELVEDDGNVDCTSVYYFECAAGAENLHKAVAALGGEHLHESFAKALEKAGARNSGADLSRIQKAHDLLGELGAKCAKDDGDDMDAEKAAHAETLSKLTAAGESVTKLTADLAAATEKVAKVEGDLEVLAKGVALITGERDELQKKFDEQAELVKKLSAEPVNPKGVINGVGAAIAKSHDFTVGEHEQEDVEPVLNPDGSVNEAATEIKKARRNGGVIVFRG
ncbi:DUF6582 domain-containing protein [Burkholderia cenocepacia]|uniref:Uncharacterized protein n=1 Tax=Burkholderia cenocepacia TaxID=95486 RepID=A0A1V2W329_9BURK|nr:DUF6582 domain-containing protein [Burkholderia cenocepacia]MBR8248686.1 hypothetical protein [Burkholderia cenocepacia]MBR8288860.1 hypothetical protein [Burkholderia cenocepacia]MBR8497130.1 hypothetical protein [Burkholderia cenocepacia]ONJ13697.1 hypothetical protein A8D83_12075 [Burkholderia cenocepacia]ONJ30198.1 hypothetical protein A8D90_07135 [Burkholderia cenocepacia]